MSVQTDINSVHSASIRTSIFFYRYHYNICPSNTPSPWRVQADPVHISREVLLRAVLVHQRGPLSPSEKLRRHLHVILEKKPVVVPAGRASTGRDRGRGRGPNNKQASMFPPTQEPIRGGRERPHRTTAGGRRQETRPTRTSRKTPTRVAFSTRRYITLFVPLNARLGLVPI